MRIEDNITKLNNALATLSLAKRQGGSIKAANIDFECLADLYGKYLSFAKEKRFSTDRHNTPKEQFILACVMIFFPNALFGGGKLNKKFRLQMAQLINRTQSSIYFILYKTIGFYDLYPKFKNEVEETYKMIYKELKQNINTNE